MLGSWPRILVKQMIMTRYIIIIIISLALLYSPSSTKPRQLLERFLVYQMLAPCIHPFINGCVHLLQVTSPWAGDCVLSSLAIYNSLYLMSTIRPGFTLSLQTKRCVWKRKLKVTKCDLQLYVWSCFPFLTRAQLISSNMGTSQQLNSINLNKLGMFSLWNVKLNLVSCIYVSPWRCLNLYAQTIFCKVQIGWLDWPSQAGVPSCPNGQPALEA